MNKRSKKLWLLSTLLFIPLIVNASTYNDIDDVFGIIFMEAFVSIHMSVFVLIPLAKMFFPANHKKAFWTLFAIRAGILLFFDFFVTPGIAFVDFFAVFVGAFIIVPICSIFTKNFGKFASGDLHKLNSNNINSRIISGTFDTTVNRTISGIKLQCAKCQAEVTVADKFCPNCGVSLEGDNLKVVPNVAGSIQVPQKELVTKANFDSIYNLSEDNLLEEFINREFTKLGIEKATKLVPENILRKKLIFNIIFCVLLFVYISIIFLHYPLYTYIIGFIILLIFFIATRRYNLMKYLKKEIKARPSEKISNIVMNVKTSFVEDNSRALLFGLIVIAISLPIIIFSKPRILYEKVDGGYAVRYYAFGLTEFKKATIPDSYKGEKVVSLRGNTFSNMPFLEEVSLPNTIYEIRGQAFLNDRKLTKVNIPRYLNYLGGGAFYNCSSITSIELPDTLTYLGGEAFYGATNLRTIKLSDNLEEIRGDTFEYCTNLESITIPDSVTRIGGHAFYGDYNLSEVIISPNSKLQEIGSSAFRQCNRLYEITLPYGISINERAFKESPTTVKYFNGEYNSNENNSIENNSNVNNSNEDKFNKELANTKNVDGNNYHVFQDGEKVHFSKYNLIVYVKNVGNYYLEIISPNQAMKKTYYNSYGDYKNYTFYDGNRIQYDVQAYTNKLNVSIKSKDELKNEYPNNKELLMPLKELMDINGEYKIKFDKYEVYSKSYNFTITGPDYYKQITINKDEGINIVEGLLMIEVVNFEGSKIKVRLYY